MTDLAVKFQALHAQSGLALTPNMIEQLLGFVSLLDKWNKAYNLTSIRDPIEMLSRHIFDSIAIHRYLDGQRFIDVGTGPGLPGIPLAIVNPDKKFYLLDSLGKRVRFIRQTAYELGLKNIIPIQSRVEDYQDTEGFDGVISRAFASLYDMVTWCEHLVCPHQGCFYALKGVYPAEELESLPERFVHKKTMPLSVVGLDAERHLVVLTKI